MQKFDRISDQIKRYAEGDYVFSLDIFDTLIVRACAFPGDVFRFISDDFRFSEMEEPFFKKSPLAETTARRRAEMSGREEVTLAEIYDVLKLDMGITDLQRDDFKRREVELEEALAIPSKFGLQLIDLLKTNKKRFVLTSDMYLPRDVIENMLAKCNISGHDALYLSSELGKTKHRGSLYEVVKSHFDTDSENIIHIGDNFFSDHKIATKAGLKSIHRPAVREVFDQARIWQGTSLFRGEAPLKMIFNGLFVEMISEPKKHPLDYIFSSDEAFWRSYGWLTVAPIMLSLANWIAKTSREQGIEHVGFFARDGAFPKRVFDLLHSDFETSYVAASRQFLTLPSTVMSPTELRNFFTRDFQHEGSRTSFLATLPGGDALGARLQTLGFDLNISMKTDTDRFLDAIGENAGLIKSSLNQRRLNAKHYLHQTLKLDQHVAIFDLGWRGSLQAGVNLMLPEHQDKILGLYFGTTHDATDKLLSQGSRYASFSMHNGAPEMFRAGCQDNADILEFLFSSDHGSVEDVRRDGDAFEWIVSPLSKAEAASQAIARQVQDGAIEAIEYALQHVRAPILESVDDRESTLSAFFNTIWHPTSEDASFFKDVRVFSGIGDSEGTPILGAGSSVFSRRSTTRWPAGFDVTMSQSDRRNLRLYKRWRKVRAYFRRILR